MKFSVHVTYGRGSDNNNAIRYVLPVLWLSSIVMFAHTGPYGLTYGTHGDLPEGSTVSISPLISLLRMLKVINKGQHRGRSHDVYACLVLTEK